MRIEWHILPEHDELSERNGSAVLNVARNLQTAARSLGHDSWIIGSKNRNNDISGALGILKSRPNILQKPWAISADKACKYLLGRSFRTPTILNSSSQPTHIYCHNQPWLISKVRQQYPEAKVYLYAHNQILQGARAAVIRKLIQSAHLVICVSDFVRHELANRAGLTSGEMNERMIAQIHGVDAGRFGPLTTGNRGVAYDIVYAGRIVPEKGLHTLLEAISLIAQKRPLSALIVGGHGFLPGNTSKYEETIQSKLRTCAAKVTITGPVPPSHIPGLLNAARLHIVPSTWDEPCGLVVLEGLASQACVIATSVGGIPEIARQTQLKLIPRENPQALAAAINEYLNVPELMEHHAHTQRAWARTQTWLSVYQNITMHDG